MIKTIIIDDEQHCTDRLIRLLNELKEFEVEIAGFASTVEEGLQLIKNNQPDLVFLDVNLGNGSGFDLLKKSGKINYSIIFCTAYDQYAVQAFRFSALDYLLKPVSKELLGEALLKMNKQKEENIIERKLELLFQNNHSTHKRIAIPDVKGIVFVPLNDIIRCQGNVNYTQIFLRNGEQFLASKTIKEFEELLKEYNFFRLHNSHLVNLDTIKRYKKGSGGSVLLEDGTELDVSVRRKDEFLRKMKNLI